MLIYKSYHLCLNLIYDIIKKNFRVDCAVCYGDYTCFFLRAFIGFDDLHDN